MALPVESVAGCCDIRLREVENNAGQYGGTHIRYKKRDISARRPQSREFATDKPVKGRLSKYCGQQFVVRPYDLYQGERK